MEEDTIPPEAKKVIDEMSYDRMLTLWRYAPVGHPLFQGETGRYFCKVMSLRRSMMSPGAHTAASKRVGWEG